MTKERLLSFAVLVLLVLNGIAVFMLLRGSDRHGPPPEDRPKQMVIDRLGFDLEQVKRYEALIDLHRVAIGEKDRVLRSVRAELFQALGSSSTTERDSLAHVIGEIQTTVERIHYDHFAALRALCKPEQLENFDALAEELSGFFGKHPPHRKGP